MQVAQRENALLKKLLGDKGGKAELEKFKEENDVARGLRLKEKRKKKKEAEAGAGAAGADTVEWKDTDHY